jgi:hypothetical protein
MDDNSNVVCCSLKFVDLGIIVYLDIIVNDNKKSYLIGNEEQKEDVPSLAKGGLIHAYHAIRLIVLSSKANQVTSMSSMIGQQTISWFIIIIIIIILIHLHYLLKQSGSICVRISHFRFDSIKSIPHELCRNCS